MRSKNGIAQCRACSVDSTPARFGLVSCATGCVAKRAAGRCLVNQERSSLEGAARIDANYFRRGHTAGRAPILTGRLYRVLCMNSKSKVDFAYASIGAYYLSTVQFFPPLRLPARAAGVGEGSLFAPCAVVAPPSGSLAPACFAICRFGSLT
jgi:hypothetical protein